MFNTLIWLNPIAFVAIMGTTAWLVSALIFTPYLFPNVQAQEYTPVTKWGKFGVSNGGFRSPEGVAVDPSNGNVFVADTANNRIQVFTSNGTFVTKWGKFG